MPEESIEIAITVPQAELQTLLDALSRNPSLKPDVLPSSGAEGGGALAVLVITRTLSSPEEYQTLHSEAWPAILAFAAEEGIDPDDTAGIAASMLDALSI